MKTFTLLASERGRLDCVLTVLCSALLMTQAARAHTLPISELTLVADEGNLHLDLTLNPSELSFFSELDANRNGTLDLREWQGQGEKVAWRILESLRISVNGQLIAARIAGLSQTYESHHISVRAHYPVDARQSKVSIESLLTGLTSESHITQVTFGAGERVQSARLSTESNKVTFEPMGASRALTSAATVREMSDFTALKANESAVTALLALLFLAALPPAAFFVMSTRFGINTQLPQIALD